MDKLQFDAMDNIMNNCYDMFGEKETKQIQKEFQFDDLDEVVTTVSNCVLGNLETKRDVQKILFKAIIMSCKVYNSNADFKTKIDTLAEMYTKE